MQKPATRIDGTIERKAVINTSRTHSLIGKESKLRKLAYTDSLMELKESFFNDLDMTSDYYLIVIYDKRTLMPLLTCRYYYEKDVILKTLAGDGIENNKKIDSRVTRFTTRNVFLIDRLSGNKTCLIYRRHRGYIFYLFYSELVRHNRDATFFAMARKDKYETLLSKYISLGLKIIGMTEHNGVQHWILIGDVRKSLMRLKSSVITTPLLLIKVFLTKQKLVTE